MPAQREKKPDRRDTLCGQVFGTGLALIGFLLLALFGDRQKK